MNLQLVVGLGNPGYDYRDSYHNVGYQAIDYLRRSFDCTETRIQPGTVYEADGGPVPMVAKPDCYVNESGGVLKNWADSLDIAPENLLVIYDDFSIDVGQLRIRPGGSAGGHNGMKSIIDALGTDTMPRIRIGIGPLPDGLDPAEFVLSPIRDDEDPIFRDIFRELPEALGVIVDEGINRAMDTWNGDDFSHGD